MESYDIFTRFARAHLSTRAERAVYLALVGASPESRTADEVAAASVLDRKDVVRVLDRLETSGIVERDEGPDGPYYLWRADMDYLFESHDASAGWVDPVCAMPVTLDTPFRATNNLGGEQRFCSSVCLAEFRAFPARFPPRPFVEGRLGRAAM
jgi:YHS domain-containing protein